jgi:hypothetical protein
VAGFSTPGSFPAPLRLLEPLPVIWRAVAQRALHQVRHDVLEALMKDRGITPTSKAAIKHCFGARNHRLDAAAPMIIDADNNRFCNNCQTIVNYAIDTTLR